MAAARKALLDKQGESVTVLDVRGISSITDYYVIASGSSPPHLKALFGEVERVLKKRGVRCYRKSHDPECGWMTMDYVDVIIQIFSRQARDYYAIEALWGEARRLD